MSGVLMSALNGNGWIKKNGEKEEIKNNNLGQNSNSPNNLCWTISATSWSRGIMTDSEMYKMYNILPEFWSTCTGALDDPFPC